MTGVVDAEAVEVGTAQGPALATVHRPAGRPRGRLVLGHGAGGGTGAPDLQVTTAAATALGWTVVLVDQPWRVAGRRVAVAPSRLDEAWLEVLAALRDQLPVDDGAPLVLGGRSAGARVACRTAPGAGADGVLCLAFPLAPPGRPGVSRADELPRTLPTLVVQGDRDPFGGPDAVRAQVPAAPGATSSVTVVGVRGDHSLRRDDDGLRAAVGSFLASLPRAGNR